MENLETTNGSIDHVAELASLVRLTDTLLSNPSAVEVSEKLIAVYMRLSGDRKDVDFAAASLRTGTDSTIVGKSNLEAAALMHGELCEAVRTLIDRLSKVIPSDQLAAELEHSTLFDRDFYIRNNADVAASGCDPALHFLTCGNAQGRVPSHTFQSVGGEH